MSEISEYQKLDRIEELAAGYQYTYGGCGQAVILAITKVLTIPDGEIGFKCASYAGLGIARMGDYCGALFGGIVSLGLASGRTSYDNPPYPEPKNLDPKTKNPISLEIAREFHKKFVKEFSSSLCRDIQKKETGKTFNLGDPEELKEFKKLNHETCASLVGKTARYAAEAIFKIPRR